MAGSSSAALRPIQRSLDIIDISSSDDDFLLDGLGDKMTTNEQDSIGHDVYSRYLAQVLEIIPNVKSEHALGLVQSHYKQFKDSVVERVLHALFEDDSYPKIETKKAKRKREDEGVGGQNKVLKLDYGNKDRPKAVGSNYIHLAFVSLRQPDLYEGSHFDFRCNYAKTFRTFQWHTSVPSSDSTTHSTRLRIFSSQLRRNVGNGFHIGPRQRLSELV